jgi:hypothetical protein
VLSGKQYEKEWQMSPTKNLIQHRRNWKALVQRTISAQHLKLTTYFTCEIHSFYGGPTHVQAKTKDKKNTCKD